jgi:hypothetical protein
MRLPFHTLKAATATIVSLWMAVLACFIGCTLPAFANSSINRTAPAPENVTEQGKSEPMMDMENCPHHSGGHSPAKPSDGKPVPAHGMSCCPLEVTVAPKAKTESLSVAPTPDSFVPSDRNVMSLRFYHSVEPVPSVWNSGRDTLLKTHLLRV